MRAQTSTKETFLAPETEQAGKIYDFIRAHNEKRGKAPEPQFFLSGDSAGDQVEIPREIYEVLVKVVEAMRNGMAVTLTPSSQTLTTQQAAELLGITRPTFVKLLNEGKIAYEKPGTHRRVRLVDVLNYMDARKNEQYAALAAMGTVDDEHSTASVERMKRARKEAARRRQSQNS